MAQKLQNIIKIVDLSESFVGLRFDKRGSLNSASYLNLKVWVTSSSACLFLPAAGNRNNSNGQLNNRGNNGYYWASTQNGTNGYYMNLNSGGANVNNNHRANGFSVRCVAAFNTLF